MVTGSNKTLIFSGADCDHDRFCDSWSFGNFSFLWNLERISKRGNINFSLVSSFFISITFVSALSEILFESLGSRFISYR